MKTTSFRKRMAMTLLLAIMTAASAWATDFVKDVMVIGGSESETDNLKSTLREQGWTVITRDLNAGASGDYIFLLYKSESNTDGINHGYITDFYIDNEFKASITYQGRTYYPVPFDGGKNFRNSHGDLNRGAAGDYIYLYYTKNNFDDKRAVTEITINDTQSGAVGLKGGTEGYDLNAKAGGKYIYMHLATETAINSHSITFADGTEDTDCWSITPVGEDLQSAGGDLQSPTFDEGTQVTLTYTGKKVVESVTGSSQWFGDLTTLNSNVIATDGMTLTGKLGAKVKVIIDRGATVKLQNVTIEGVNRSTCSWAGINCWGDATLVLSGTNYVKGFNGVYPGIFFPEGKTLTIRGNGSLEVLSNNMGAGIGGGYLYNCGNIVIEGGTIIAHGGNGAAAIGGGSRSNCGNITITDGVSSVTAYRGQAPYSIGPGSDGKCGTVTIGGKETGHISNKTYTYEGKGTSTSEMPEGTPANPFAYRSLNLTPGEAGNTWTFTMPEGDVLLYAYYYDICDVNKDGYVDVADIACVIDVMAGNTSAGGILQSPTWADVNGDGSIDVADIASIISEMANY